MSSWPFFFNKTRHLKHRLLQRFDVRKNGNRIVYGVLYSPIRLVVKLSCSHTCCNNITTITTKSYLSFYVMHRRIDDIYHGNVMWEKAASHSVFRAFEIVSTPTVAANPVSP